MGGQAATRAKERRDNYSLNKHKKNEKSSKRNKWFVCLFTKFEIKTISKKQEQKQNHPIQSYQPDPSVSNKLNASRISSISSSLRPGRSYDLAGFLLVALPPRDALRGGGGRVE